MNSTRLSFPRTEFDALLERVHAVHGKPNHPSIHSVAFDCLRMFPELAQRIAELKAENDRLRLESHNHFTSSIAHDKLSRKYFEMCQASGLPCARIVRHLFLGITRPKNGGHSHLHKKLANVRSFVGVVSLFG